MRMSLPLASHVPQRIGVYAELLREFENLVLKRLATLSFPIFAEELLQPLKSYMARHPTTSLRVDHAIYIILRWYSLRGAVKEPPLPSPESSEVLTFNYLQHALEGDWSEFPHFFDRVYRICRYYAGSEPKSFVEFLLENGHAEQAEEWWPGYLVPESPASPYSKKRQADAALRGNDTKRHRKLTDQTVDAPSFDQRDIRIESLQKEVMVLREREKQLFNLAGSWMIEKSELRQEVEGLDVTSKAKNTDDPYFRS